MRIYPFFIAQEGCPQRCLFCRQEATSGHAAAPSPEEICRALDRMLPLRGDGEVAFYGGSFTLLPAERQQAYFTAVNPFVRCGRVAGIRISTRPDGLAEPVVDFLASSGVSTVEIGCQSFSADVLRQSCRGHGPELAEVAVCRLRRAGLRIGLQLMPGLPGGDRTEAIASLRKAIDLRPDFLRIYPTVVLRGTGLEALWRSGDYTPLELDEAVELCADLFRECRRADIPVIRLGLQATSELDDGDAIAAGPYHPAFGQLVRSRLWRRVLERVRSGSSGGAFHLNPADLSDAIGHRRDNLNYLQRRYGPIALTPDPNLPRESLRREGEHFALLDLSGYEV